MRKNDFFTNWTDDAPAEKKTILNNLLIVRQVDTPVGRVTIGDLFSGLDVLLGEQDLDFELILVPVGRVGNTGVVDSGQAEAYNRSDIFGRELKKLSRLSC